jgi:hypothetical protein
MNDQLGRRWKQEVAAYWRHYLEIPEETEENNETPQSR